MHDEIYRSASRLAADIRAGRLGSEELTRRYLDRIAGRGSALNAVVILDEEGALTAARAADAAVSRGEELGPLHGVPVSIKDSFDVAGLRATSGYRPLEARVAERDATVVARLRRAGAVILGKTNVPPLAGDWQTSNPIFGPTLNPWDLSRTPGGSSGGSAVAVAAGLSALDIGSDLGGSLRVPASFCGVVTLKPTEWRVSGAGHVPDGGIPGTDAPRGHVQHMGVYGPLARRVGDLDLSMSLLAGPDRRRPTVPPVPWRGAERRSPASLRLALAEGLPPARAGSATRSILAEAARRFADAGARLEPLAERDVAALEIELAWKGWGHVAGMEAAACGSPRAGHADLDAYRASVAESPLESSFFEGMCGDVRAYFTALAWRERFIRRIDALLDDRDALLLPVTSGPAFEPCAGDARLDVDGLEMRYVEYVAGHVAPFSFSGHPVVSLPAGRTEGGLPVGIQVVGRRLGDESLLAVAQALEDVLGDYEPPPEASDRGSLRPWPS